jgi:hypothetical protein
MIPEHKDEEWLDDEDGSKGDKEGDITRAIMGIADLKLPLKLGSLIGSSQMPDWPCVACKQMLYMHDVLAIQPCADRFCTVLLVLMHPGHLPCVLLWLSIVSTMWLSIVLDSYRSLCAVQ